jgi:pleckstrin homology domain-containing family F
LKVEKLFGSSGVHLAAPDRVLVGEGILVKMCRKTPKPRQFFLFNDLFVYGTMVTRNMLTRQHVIPLEGVKLDNLEDEGDERNGWTVRTPTKSFNVYAATAGEKREWMLHLERCVRELLKEGRQPAAEHAPPWVPDEKTKVKEVFKDSKFKPTPSDPSPDCRCASAA